MTNKWSPTSFYKAQANEFAAAITQVRAHLPHNTSKGYAIEQSFASLLRRALPMKYTLSSGLMTNHLGDLSNQTDIIVHDALNNLKFRTSPDIEIFPIETVFGAIEVKTTLNSAAMKQWFEASSKVRAIAREKHYAGRPRVQGSKVLVSKVNDPVPPRMYLVAFESSIGLQSLADQMAEQAALGNRTHGIFVLKEMQLAYLGYQDAQDERLLPAVADGFEHLLHAMLLGFQTLGVRDIYMQQYLGEIWDGSSPSPQYAIEGES